MRKQYKFRVHFNRVNMQRGNDRVWTVHYRRACHQVHEVVFASAEAFTVFAPEKRQPRAWFEGRGKLEVLKMDGKDVAVIR